MRITVTHIAIKDCIMKFFNREKELEFLRSIKERTAAEAQMTVKSNPICLGDDSPG